MFDSLLKWAKTLDAREVIYPLLATAVAALIAGWLGGFRGIKRQIILRRALTRYKKALRKSCLSLTVIGRREGFSLEQTYVPLDIAPSDLASPKATTDGETWRANSKYVLVAGPGAGKSTFVKKAILDRLAAGGPTPFLVRLREYDPERSIQQHLADQLRAYGVPDPEREVLQSLQSPTALFVLDGLDEVRPHLARTIHDRINFFYHDCASSPASLIVTCRKEAYRDLPLDIESIREVRPLTDEQMTRFAKKWPLTFPLGKNAETFISDLTSTRQIYELARSPLLLVGGLMQYTESNLGIPQERVQYLARIAQWLVSDWAIAQGHHADKYRTLYPRILSRLALQMHCEGRSEYPSKDAVDLIASWIPEYGFDSTDAREVLAGLLAKTGILVRDLPQLIVFSQFGLQEYYASIDLLTKRGPGDLSEIAEKVWWREAILLAIAQQSEPTDHIVRLFSVNALLAAESVAESPTPSLALQERAILSCLESIDRQIPAAQGATISLLRRVKGSLEERLALELERRLTNTIVAPEAGNILALAGTPSTTAALARHPSIWGNCLQTAGYLSSSLENLLVLWIKDGDESQSRHAADLLANKLSSDRLAELIGLLPNLPTPKAGYVATMLLKHIAGQEPYRTSIDPNQSIKQVSICASMLPKEVKLKDVMGTNDLVSLRFNRPSEYIVPAVALHCARASFDASRLENTVLNAAACLLEASPTICWIGASIVLCAYGSRFSSLAALLGTFTVIAANFAARLYPVSLNGFIFRTSGSTSSMRSALLVLLGASCFSAIQGQITFQRHSSLARTLFVALTCYTIGIIMERGRFFRRKVKRKIDEVARVAAIILCGVCFAGVVFSHWTANIQQLPIQAVGSLFLIFFLLSMYQMNRDMLITLRAVEAEEQHDRIGRVFFEPDI
jgi:hypothetical protein